MKSRDLRAARRERERQRNLMGETLDDYHARENPSPTRPGAHLTRRRCSQTPSLFDGSTDRETRSGITDLFARLFSR